ncbi:hypothetical protein Dimus_027480 [Dionaea muscipula]
MALESFAVDEAKGALNIVLATAVDEIKLTWGFRGGLNKLKKRLKTLQEILLGAGTSQSLNNLQQDWVEQVKMVAHHADDLFDEFSFENLRRKLEIKDRYYNKGSPLNARYWFYFSLSTIEPPCQLDFAEWLIRPRMSQARDLGIKATKLVAATGIDRSFGADLSFVAIVGIPELATTRTNAVTVDIVKAPVVHPLEGLEDEDSWALFKQTVFANGETCPENLEESGRKIVGKCNGVPLAIKTLGATLRRKRYLQDWESIENSELWKLSEYGDRIMLYLLLSFQHLSSLTLKQCFAYCSIYGKGAEISKKDLIELWMAQSLLFLQQGSSLKMEEIGENYFNVLLNYSFLQLPKQNEFGGIITCKIVHDLARFSA